VSLYDLEKRAILKPVEAELDRQKEKAAKFKKKLKKLQAAATELVDAYNYDHLAKERLAAMEELKRAILESKE
jgi:predicted metallo-beta-lactamase superfamily hydrolase